VLFQRNYCKLTGIPVERKIVMDNNNSINTLRKSCGKSGIIVSIMLILSLIFNISALLTPFYTAKMFMSSPYTCTLPGSILLMWQYHLLLIALLIFAFSIVFPLFKLTVLYYTWFFCRDIEKREHLITVIGPLGKWSMLDIFMTAILLVMTNDQFMITSTLKMGVYYFLAAIFLSMTCALRIETLIFNKGIKSSAENISFIKSYWNMSIIRRVFIFLLLIVSLIALIMTVNAPIIQINDFFFADNEYSIVTSIAALWNTSRVLTIFVGFTLLLAPLLHILGLFLLWPVKLRPKNSHLVERFVHAISMFNMLDVFCLGLLIFISGGSELIITREKNGLYVLLLFLLCLYLIPIFINGTHKNYLQFIKKIAGQK
jgi:paraquat-inducible protein A